MVFILLLACAGMTGIHAQTASQMEDPSSLIGLTIKDMISRFGVPDSVYAVRGGESWQDDVVFVYQSGDFYILKYRVWQVGVKKAHEISIGDPRQAVLLVLGEKAKDSGNFITADLPGKGWPLALRCEFDGANRVSALFIYRSDI